MSMKPPIKHYRAMRNLAYNPELCPDARGGKLFAKAGDITELYPELLAYPDRVKLLLDLGAIEEVPIQKIIRPPKEEQTSEES